MAADAVVLKGSVYSCRASMEPPETGPSGHAQETPAYPHALPGSLSSQVCVAPLPCAACNRGSAVVLPSKVATMTPPLSVTIRRDDLRKKFRRPPDLDEERQSTGIGTGHVSAPSRRTH